MNKYKKLRTIGIVVWSSFLSASIATMIFFSMFDPETLGHLTTFPISLSRIGGYSLGFLLFWSLTIFCSGLTAFLLSISNKKLKKSTFKEDDYDDSAYE